MFVPEEEWPCQKQRHPCREMSLRFRILKWISKVERNCGKAFFETLYSGSAVALATYHLAFMNETPDEECHGGR